jgi:hypothetical protein
MHWDKEDRYLTAVSSPNRLYLLRLQEVDQALESFILWGTVENLKKGVRGRLTGWISPRLYKRDTMHYQGVKIVTADIHKGIPHRDSPPNYQ